VRVRLFDPGGSGPVASLGLLVARLAAGGLLVHLHGWGKLVSFAERAATFPDPLGIGSRYSMMGAIAGEVVVPLLVAAGLATRLAAVPPAFTMAVAAFVVNAGEPWKEKELAVMYLSVFVVLMFTGGGRYSLDALASGGRKPRART
jgi:putative oxidoreductase